MVEPQGDAGPGDAMICSRDRQFGVRKWLVSEFTAILDAGYRCLVFEKGYMKELGMGERLFGAGEATRTWTCCHWGTEDLWCDRSC